MSIVLLLLSTWFNDVQEQYSLVQLGDSTVMIEQQRCGQGKAFVHLHQNETTALQAAMTVVQSDGGSVLTLIHSGGRTITFHLNDKTYEFDPNRMFTAAGRKKTLTDLSEYTPEADRLVKKLATKVQSMLPKGKLIAVHNNKAYSLNDYLAGHELASDARALYVSQDEFYRNFYLVTKRSDYLRLKKLNLNSILQATTATDDGSLSVRLARQPYINVEAGFDELTAQIRMLRLA